MSQWKSVLVFGAVLLCAGFFNNAQADEWNKKTIMTFNHPVEIPGQVLPAGTYVFKLMDSPSDRNIVQVYNKDETHLYGTILAIPDYRMQPTGKSVVTFEEKNANSPEAVREWFYPGDNFGQEFVYPRERATQIANAANQPVLSAETQPNTPPAQMRQAPVTHVAPAPQPQQTAQATPPPTPPPAQTQPAPQPAQPAPQPAMPHTASDYPLIALAGVLLVVASFGIGFLVKRAA